jgi:hypothetical protein
MQEALGSIPTNVLPHQLPNFKKSIEKRTRQPNKKRERQKTWLSHEHLKKILNFII